MNQTDNEIGLGTFPSRIYEPLEMLKARAARQVIPTATYCNFSECKMALPMFTWLLPKSNKHCVCKGSITLAYFDSGFMMIGPLCLPAFKDFSATSHVFLQAEL